MHNASDERSELELLCDAFRDRGVEFIVIGGQAEYLLGSDRATFDFDFCYRRTPENIRRLAEAIAPFNPRLRGLPAELQSPVDAHTLNQGTNFTFTTDLGDLDLLAEVAPLGGYEELLESAEVYNVGGQELHVISLDDLIRIKEHVGRDKDRDSLRHLRAIKQIRDEQGGD